MFHHFLVPLDGSRLAEMILPVAQTLARATGATITLLHVVEPAPPQTVHGELHLMDRAAADEYLGRIAAELGTSGIAADHHVDVAIGGDVVKAIFNHGGELGADLILLTSHGRGGLRQAVFGSIAQQVLQSGAIPVLVIKAEQAALPVPYECDSILVPLDSSPLYERALVVGAALAKSLGAALELVLVVPTSGTLSPERAATGILLPSSTRAVLDLAESGARDYLEAKLDEYQVQGLDTHGRVLRGDVPTEILNAQKETGADLIVMATHGRAGLDAFWSGSIAPRVLNHAGVPVLLLRVTGPEPVR